MAVHTLQPARAADPGPSPPPSPVRRRHPPWGWIALAVALAAALAVGGWLAQRPIPVRLAVTRAGQAVDAVYASGVVEYVRQARVAPVVTAPIARVLVDEGQTVRRGQTLAQLDDGPQLGATLQLEAQAALARATADRAQRLFDAGFGARAAAEDAQAQRRAAEAAAGGARARLADFRLKAPFAGRVLRRDAEPGDLATAGQPMFMVANPSALRITADVDERDVGRLAVGQQAMVRADAFPQQVFPGRIAEITPQGDSTGRVFRVRVALPQGTPLKPGMTVETNMVTAQRENAVLAPSAAVSRGAVWTVRGGRAYRLPVKTGAAGADSTEVVAGLAAGTAVILDPPADLKDRGRVTVRPAR